MSEMGTYDAWLSGAPAGLSTKGTAEPECASLAKHPNLKASERNVFRGAIA